MSNVKTRSLDSLLEWAGPARNELAALKAALEAKESELADYRSAATAEASLGDEARDELAALTGRLAEFMELAPHDMADYHKLWEYFKSENPEAGRDGDDAGRSAAAQAVVVMRRLTVRFKELEAKLAAESMAHQALIDKLAAVRRECFPAKPCELKGALCEMRDEILSLRKVSSAAREAINEIVIAEGEDAGVILLSDNSSIHYDPKVKCHVYDYENFSPLGDELVALARLLGSKVEPVPEAEPAKTEPVPVPENDHTSEHPNDEPLQAYIVGHAGIARNHTTLELAVRELCRRELERHMDKNKTGLFELVEGLEPVDASALAEYEREMTDEAIPEMLREVKKRRMLAAESRHRQLEMSTTDIFEPTNE